MKLSKDLPRNRSCSCPICETTTKMVSTHEWLRDNYRCSSCNSIPRDRALRRILTKYFPDWKEKLVVEFAPSNGLIKQAASNYLGSQYYPNLKLGKVINGYRNENLEETTFEDNSIDIIIHLDVMEHIFRPDKAVQEMSRILKPKGAAIFTFPIYKDLERSKCRAKLSESGEIIHILPEEYHGNPVGDGKSLVTWHYGQDILSLFEEWINNNNIDVERFNEQFPDMGIEGEFLDVFVIKKRGD
ncbi:MAG: class I SAM-dependent methyltransferase [Candidatus Heimdallarchaeota archaeon]|nr:class I SAM-dependent methyltransferase [Candidatus Heimdallarchaeota archaeon]